MTDDPPAPDPDSEPPPESPKPAPPLLPPAPILPEALPLPLAAIRRERSAGTVVLPGLLWWGFSPSCGAGADYFDLSVGSTKSLNH